MQNFLRSLIFPLKMRRYRHMSVLVSILIFVVTIYILQFPYRVATNRSKPKLIEDNELNIHSLYYLDDTTFDFEELSSMDYVIKEMKLHSNIDKTDGRFSYSFSYVHNGTEYATHFVMDPNNTVEEEVKAVQDYYKEKFEIKSPTEDETKKIITIANIYYIESLKDETLDKDARLTELHALTSKQLAELVNEFSIFDLYDKEITEGVNDSIVVFRSATMTYFWESTNTEKQSFEAAEFYYADDMVVNFSDEGSLPELGKALANYVMQMYINTLQNKQALNLVLSVLLFPPILVLVIWLFFRRDGAMKRYKEYYNILAISSLVPTLAIFFACFLWAGVLTFYPALLLVYYLFMVYRINSAPVDVN